MVDGGGGDGGGFGGQGLVVGEGDQAAVQQVERRKVLTKHLLANPPEVKFSPHFYYKKTCTFPSRSLGQSFLLGHQLHLKDWSRREVRGGGCCSRKWQLSQLAASSRHFPKRSTLWARFLARASTS